jgi:hypothetical protein
MFVHPEHFGALDSPDITGFGHGAAPNAILHNAVYSSLLNKLTSVNLMADLSCRKAQAGGFGVPSMSNNLAVKVRYTLGSR